MIRLALPLFVFSLLATGAQTNPPKPATPPTPPVAAPATTSTDPATFVKPNRPLPPITGLAYSPDGKKLAVGSTGQVVVFDTSNWQQSALFRQVEDSVRSLSFHPDSQKIAIGSGIPGRSGQTTLWDISNATPPHIYQSHFDTIENVAFRKDGKGLLIAANDSKVQYLASITAKEGKLLDSHNGRVQAVAFSPTEDTIFISGAMDRIVKVWDMKEVRNVVNFDQSESGITGLAFLTNGIQFVGSSLDGRLYWWGVNHDKEKNAYSGYHFRTIGAHENGVYALSASTQSNRMVTGGADHAVKIWDINSGGQIRAFADTTKEPIYAVAISPDGKIAVGGGREGLVYVWEVDANKHLATLVPPAIPLPPVKTTPPPTKPAPKAKKR